MRTARFSLPLDCVVAGMLLLCTALVLLSLQNPTAIDDGLRHFTMAKIMREQGIWNVPGWSAFFYEGYLHTVEIDPWFLSHVLLIPFTVFSIAKGLQLFIICTVASLLTGFLLLLHSLRLSAQSRAIFLIILVFGDTQFMGRFLFGRPYAVMTALSLFVLWAIIERRWIILGICLSASVLLSQLFIFPLLFCICGLMTFLLFQKYRDAASISITSIVGILLGFMLHPHPLLYSEYMDTVFLKIPFLQSIGLSREMTFGILKGAFLSILVLLTVGFLFGYRLMHRHSVLWLQKQETAVFLTICVIPLTLVFMMWLRTIDIIWPVLLLWVASLYALDRSAVRDLLRTLLPENKKMMMTLKWAGILYCMANILILPYLFIRDDTKHSLKPYETMRLIPTHRKVLNLDWDHFFVYMALRPDLQYATGIDRAFTYITDPTVSTLIHSLEQINSSVALQSDIQKTLDGILSEYRSDYLVLSHAQFDATIHTLQKNQAFGLLSDNGTIAIYAVPDWYKP